MKRSPSLALAVIALATTLNAATPATQPTLDEWFTAPTGKIMLHTFPDTAPYPHNSRKDGFKNSAGETFGPEHYQDSTVGFIVPNGYTPGDHVDYIVHFHGWHNHVSKVIAQFQLAEQLNKSGLNAIMIVPQGPLDAPDSGDGRLELDDGGFKQFIDEVTKYLNAEHIIHTSKIGHIALSAHSGGYKVAASTLHRGGITDSISDVFLLDATYGNLAWFDEYVSKRPDARIVTFHTKHLDDENEQLKKLLDASHTPNREVLDKDFSGTTIAPRGVSFVPTLLAHDDVPAGNDHMATCLATSALDKIVASKK